MLVRRPPKLVAQAAALELGLQPGPEVGAVAGEAGIALMHSEQQPAAVAVAGHLAEDERRETDSAFFVERAERVPAEDVSDLHDLVRPPLRNRHGRLRRSAEERLMVNAARTQTTCTPVMVRGLTGVYDPPTRKTDVN